MTTKERILKSLTDRGLSTGEAEQRFTATLPEVEQAVQSYRVTWDRPASEYPDPFYAVIGMYFDRKAVEFIDANCPMAWFRPLFTAA